MKKVAIIGAGIIGLYLAQKLSQKKYNIFLFEKNKKIGEKVCSGLYSERILDFIPEARNFIQNKINFVLIHFPKKTIKVLFKKRLYVIDRNSLEKFLLEKLKKEKKVNIFLNFFIKKIPKKFDRVIGTDGANSFLRKILKEKSPNFYFAEIGYLNKKDFSNFVEVWPHKEGGFLWKIPRGEKIEYGIFGEREKAQNVNKIFEKFLKENKIDLIDKKGSLIAIGFILPRNKKITLCGEATGIVKPWSGGGVIWSLKSAQFLLENFPDFFKYRNKVINFFFIRFYLSKILRKMVYFFGFHFPFFLPKEIEIDPDFLI